jgi:hypothetical protein
LLNLIRASGCLTNYLTFSILSAPVLFMLPQVSALWKRNPMQRLTAERLASSRMFSAGGGVLPVLDLLYDTCMPARVSYN